MHTTELPDMLETIDLKAKLSKKEYHPAMDELDRLLAEYQRRLDDAGVPVLIIVEGWESAGKGPVLSRLLQVLDPRGFKVRHFKKPTGEENWFPPMRRFWTHLPPHGKIAIYDRSWYRQVLDVVLEKSYKESEMAEAYDRIRQTERQLTDNGMLILKFFFHISKKTQAKRFDKLREDPAFAWKVGKEECRQHKHYREMYTAVEDMLRETSTASSPWHVIPGTNERYAIVRTAELIVAAMENAINLHEQKSRETPIAAREQTSKTPHRSSPLDRVDLTLAVARDEYKKRLSGLQDEVRRLQHMCYRERRSALVVYEGWDAAGKGGNIRRLVRSLDPRGYDVATFAAPTGVERLHHYLWRFWRDLPKAGHLTVFDRSHYGRVLVERIEGFATQDEWQRAFKEINEFESQLADDGMIVVKFWIHIDKDEQLARFKAREENPEKQWKITEEDWRNREKWDVYHEAVSDMIERTSTLQAPWTIIEGNDKLHARLHALETVTQRLRAGLGLIN